MRKLFKPLSLICVLLLLVGYFPPCVSAADEPIRIAFIDSGISTKHIDPDHVENGKNYVFPESDTQDRVGHGTATAGLVLGAPEQDVAGVYPDAVAVPLVVVDKYPAGAEKNGGPEALCAAIRDAVDEFHCRIINVSLATAEDSEALRAAVAYAEAKGAVIVTVTGNDGSTGGVYYPAAYDTVIAVGSADGRGVASFSQGGADVVTGGVGLSVATNKNSDASDTVSGTSYSCALVSGLCAKIAAAYPDFSPAQLRRGLYAMAEDILAPGYDERSGWGVVDAAAEIAYPYLDVPADDGSAEAISRAAERGYMNGVGGGLFAPKETMTRGMLAAVLHRMAGEPKPTGSSRYSDVADGRYYSDAVIWTTERGILWSWGRFEPQRPVTRELMAATLWRMRGEPEADTEALSAFTDASQVSTWARIAMAWAIEKGVISGDHGCLSPKTAVTRAEAACILSDFER